MSWVATNCLWSTRVVGAIEGMHGYRLPNLSEIATKCPLLCPLRSLTSLHPRWSVRARERYIRSGSPIRTPHTYLDGTCLFTYLGVWAVGAIHSTATLSSEGTCGLYGLRLVHRPNIFLSCFGPRAGQAIFFPIPRKGRGSCSATREPRF